MNVFTVKSVQRDLALTDVFRGVIPFVLAYLVALLVIVSVPQIATFLPSLM
jgi:TRAP-type C4-dicarboxylate transport system permease large subunit